MVRIQGHIALFSHGQFGRALAMTWIGQPVHVAEHYGLETASLSILGRSGGLEPVPAIELWNALPDRTRNLRLMDAWRRQAIALR